MEKKYDYEGDLDGLERWLNNLNKTEALPLGKQKEIEWEKNAKELRDLISKMQKRIDHEKRMGEGTRKERTIETVLKDVANDWKWQVKDMDDEELKDDRSDWMKRYGREGWRSNEEYGLSDYDSDIHTLSLEMEQLRRWGAIYYDDQLKPMTMKEEIMSEIDTEKVGIAFAFFVLSKVKDEQIHSLLDEYREVFKEIVLGKAKQEIPVDSKSDDIVNQHKEIEITNDVAKTTERNMRDIEMMVNNLKMNKDDWKKVLGQYVYE